MALRFQGVPGWVSWKNQGANITVADLDKDGKPELIVLRVDHPAPGPNRGFYRVGQALDAQGAVQKWGGWHEIPQWDAAENQGAGLAIADFGAAGLALVVFQIEHVVPGPNKGRYRIGLGLGVDGGVTGWSAWQEVPNWISWRDQGGAIAVADLDGNGKPDLVVLHIDDFHTDNPRRPNKAFYRIGKNLAADGSVQGWGDWQEVDWFSWFNHGAGLAIGDLDGNGRPEILVFQIDVPPGENVAWARVGWNLDEAGAVQDGWGPWVRFDGWGGRDNQGVGFASGQSGERVQDSGRSDFVIHREPLQGRRLDGSGDWRLST